MQLFIKTIFAALITTANVIHGSPHQKRNLLSPNDIQLILAEHNNHRTRHGAAPLKWDDRLAAYADLYSRKCSVNHNSGSSYGENIAGRSLSWVQSVDAWYNEEVRYNYSHPEYNARTGHFTQIVWQNTKHIGCAVTYCDNIKGNLYVCEYEPRGNTIYGGGDPAFYYKTNVTAPL